MCKLFSLMMCILLLQTVSGQTNAFPKLEKLYAEKQYDKCLEKAEAEIRENAQEIIPYVWEMRCYLAIDRIDEHPLQKNALSKALNTAVRIKKKDKQELLTKDIQSDIELLSERLIQYIGGLPENQYASGLSLYEKLKTVNSSMLVEYHQYKYMESHNDAYAFVKIKNLVIRHYALFRKNTKDLENLEAAYADLMNAYFEHNHADYAKDVFIKAKEVYREGTLCRMAYIDHIADIGDRVGYYTEDAMFKPLLDQCYAADSLLDDAQIQMSITKIRKFNTISKLRNITVPAATTTALILEYLKSYTSHPADSTDAYFDDLLRNNKQEKWEIDNNRIFAQWLAVKSEWKHLKPGIETIKNIHTFNINKKKYEQDFDFLNYCKTTYPAQKPAIKPLETELEKLIVVQISDPNYVVDADAMEKYAKKSDSKVILEKQYQMYIKRLTGLLAANNFSGFAVNIVKALSQYPDDAALLQLKKEWVIKDYLTNYKNSTYGYEQFFTKLPDEAKCDPGIVNKKGHDIVLQKINYCRRLAGVPDSCVLDEELNLRCQKAALMMSANGNLNHTPPKTWKCYTAEGAGAAGASNLSLGHAFHDAIMGQMEDGGSGNTACGHRRWILNPKNTVFGHGSSTNATSLYVFGSGNPKLRRTVYFNDKQAVCWPSTDYFPVNLIPDRWSFSLSGAEFENAKVSVTLNGKALPVSIEPLSYGYGMNTIVWTIGAEIEVNKAYTVTISNIKPFVPWGASAEAKPANKTITYHVIPLQIN